MVFLSLVVGDAKGEDCRPRTAMDIAERPFRIRIKRPGMAVGAGHIRVNGRRQARLAELPKDSTSEVRIVQRGTSQRQQRFVYALLMLGYERPRDPLREHR